MKITLRTVMWMILAFVWSIFMGVTAISIGIGAAFPPLNLVAKPFVCLDGQMNSETHVLSNPLPGTTYVQVTWYCVDKQTDTKTALEMFPMSLYSGAFYGFLLFVVVLIIWYLVKRRDVRAGNSIGLAQAQQYARQAKQYREQAEQR